MRVAAETFRDQNHAPRNVIVCIIGRATINNRAQRRQSTGKCAGIADRSVRCG